MIEFKLQVNRKSGNYRILYREPEYDGEDYVLGEWHEWHEGQVFSNRINAENELSYLRNLEAESDYWEDIDE
jgi:hypothetical protein